MDLEFDLGACIGICVGIGMVAGLGLGAVSSRGMGVSPRTSKSMRAGTGFYLFLPYLILR